MEKIPVVYAIQQIQDYPENLKKLISTVENDELFYFFIKTPFVVDLTNKKGKISFSIDEYFCLAYDIRIWAILKSKYSFRIWYDPAKNIFFTENKELDTYIENSNFCQLVKVLIEEFEKEVPEEEYARY